MAHTQTEELFVLNSEYVCDSQSAMWICGWCPASSARASNQQMMQSTGRRARSRPARRAHGTGSSDVDRTDAGAITDPSGPACTACRSLSSAVCCSHALMHACVPRFDCCRDVMPSAAHGQDPSLPYQNPSNSRNLRGMCPHRTSFGSTTTSVHYSCLWKNILYTIRLACENTIHYSCIYGQLLARKNII